MPAPQAPKPSAPAAPQATASSAAAKPAIPATHTPTPAQQNPNVRKPMAPYLPPTSPDAPKDPMLAFKEREKAALQSRGADRERRQVAEAPEGAAPPPKAAALAKPTAGSTAPDQNASAAGSAKKDGTQTKDSKVSDSETTTADATKSTSDTEAPGDASAPSTAAPAASPKGPRYEAKAMKKWLEENPEDGAALLTSLGVLTKDTETGFIKLANKRRKVREELTTKEKELESKFQAREEAMKRDKDSAEAAVGSVKFIADMWEAAVKVTPEGKHEPDFDMLDEAFRVNARGLTLDAYLRMRARRGVANPESARLKAENARLARELAASKTNGAAASAPAAGSGAPDPVKPAAAPAEPKVNASELWGPEVPKSHGLRRFDGWADELHTEMQRYHDETTDEYSVDVEDVANSLLKKKLAELAPVDELEPPAPKRRPAAPPPKRPVTPASKTAAPKASFTPPAPDPGSMEPDKFMAKMADRERWALDRAARRARGEQVD